MTPSRSPRWLASVTGAGEALQALDAGADVIDAKDPGSGALGALPPAVVRDIVASLAGRAPVSATLGDRATMDPADLAAATLAMTATGVDLVKIGLFPHSGLAGCIAALRPLARRHRLVGVVFADRLAQYPMADALHALPRLLASAHWAGIMLDTADKRAGGLLAHCPPAALQGFVDAARHAGLLCGLAGSLAESDIARLAPLGPDLLGFRGALCRDAARARGFDPERLRSVAAAMHRVRLDEPVHAGA